MSADATPPRIGMPFENWPQSDRTFWSDALSEGGLFDDGGAFSHMADGSVRVHRQHYGQWLSFLALTHPHLLDEAPADRITPEVVSGYIDAMASRTTHRAPRGPTAPDGRALVRPRTIATAIVSLASVARVLDPDEDFAWLWRAARRLYLQSNPYELKPPLPVEAHEIFQWSYQTLRTLTTEPLKHPKSHAVAFRQALMVGLLITAPVRIRALLGMTVDNHVDFAGTPARLRFRPEDMKDKKARNIPVHSKLQPHLLAYVERHRPVLLDGKTASALWISERGNALTSSSFASGLTIVTERAFGFPFRAHAFRAIAATSIAEYAPESVGIIRDILGHATLDMAEKHYNRATAKKASQRYQDLTHRLRKESNRARSRKRKP